MRGLKYVIAFHLCFYHAPVFADLPPAWGPSDKVDKRSFKDRRGNTVEFELREQENYSVDMALQRFMVRWCDKRGCRKHVFFDGVSTFRLSYENINFKDDTLTYRLYPTSRYSEDGSYTIFNWRLDGKSFVPTGEKIVAPYARARKKMEAALQRGEIGLAGAILSTMGTTPNGGHTNLEGEFFYLFFEAIYQKSNKLFRAGRYQEAASWVYWFFINPPIDIEMALMTIPDSEESECQPKIPRDHRDKNLFYLFETKRRFFQLKAMFEYLNHSSVVWPAESRWNIKHFAKNMTKLGINLENCDKQIN